MYIGRLRLQGFKSFGGTHDLPLCEGLLAIVGPNGSGKSNLLDAIRWGLGECNPGKLRILRQSDLAFQGSLTFPQANETEVGLELRERERRCSIKRRLSSDGGTQVFIDGIRSTLGQLEVTKRIWHLEGDRFAFIGQGEVFDVIQQRPTSRRLLLESLIGLDLYRKRREEAAGRLKEIEEEYERIRLLWAELRARRAAIAFEVERAARAQGLMESVNEFRGLLYWQERLGIEAEVQKLRVEASRLQRQLAQDSVWFSSWSSLKQRLEEEKGEISTKYTRAQTDLPSLSSRMEGWLRKGFAAATELAALRKAIKDLDEEEKRLLPQASSLKGERDESEARRAELFKEISHEESELLFLKEKRDLLKKDRLARAEKRRGLLDQKAASELRLAQMTAKLAMVGREFCSLSGKRLLLDQKLLEAEREVEPLSQYSLELQEKWNLLVLRHAEAYTECQRIAAEQGRIRREVTRLKAERNDLEDRLQLEIYPRPVQHLLSAVKLGRLMGPLCPVIEAFSCDPALSEPLEVYLGGRQFWLFAGDIQVVRCSIEQLKASSVGRATFLPKERFRPRRKNSVFSLPKEGVRGWACELIEIDPQWTDGVAHLLGDLLIVETFEVATALVAKGFPNPIVTLEGDVFQTFGAISGGKSKERSRAIALRRSLEDLDAKVEEMEKLLSLKTDALRSAEESEAVFSDEKERLNGKKRALEEKMRQAHAEKERLLAQRDAEERERCRLKRVLCGTGKDFLEVGNFLKKVEQELLEFPARGGWEDDSLENEIELKEKALLSQRDRLKALSLLASRIRGEWVQVSGRLGTIQKERKTLKERIEAKKNLLAEVGKRYWELCGARQVALKEESDIKKKKDCLEKSFSVAERHLKEASGRLMRTRMAQDEIQSRLSQLLRERERLISSWEEQFPFPAPKPTLDQEVETLKRKLRQNEKALRDMGEVDFGVLSEDRSLEERIGLLSKHTDDIRESLEGLKKLIEVTDDEAKNRFNEALHGINRRFDFLFKALFGGGEAHLDLLEAPTLWDCGVDLTARPPGKRHQNIAQLSGGEQSLAAIALLFAAMEVAGVPIAVLDEVDAALDEVNLHRFGELAEEYAKSLQILAMTHRRFTMERASVLYGVTFSEPGLSQIVGVRLEDWS